MCNYCMSVGLGEIPCSPLAGFYSIHCLSVASLSSGHDFRCFCQFVWSHFFLLSTLRFWVPSYKGVSPAVWMLIYQFCCATDGYVFADCGSVDLLFGIPCGIGIVLVVVISHCCWSYYVCRISRYLRSCYVFGGTGVLPLLLLCCSTASIYATCMIILTRRKWNAQM
jgi:hypothetical protein